MDHLPNSSPMDFGTRLHWVRTHLRDASKRKVAALCGLPERRIRSMEEGEDFINDDSLRDILNVALSLDVFFPWLLDGLGHPYDKHINQHIEWIRAAACHWRAPDHRSTLPLINTPLYPLNEQRPEIIVQAQKNSALAPTCPPGASLISNTNLPVAMDHWVLFQLKAPYWSSADIPRYMRKAEDAAGEESLCFHEDDSTFIDLLPANPLHLAYRIPQHLIQFTGPVIGQTAPTDSRPRLSWGGLHRHQAEHALSHRPTNLKLSQQPN